MPHPYTFCFVPSFLSQRLWLTCRPPFTWAFFIYKFGCFAQLQEDMPTTDWMGQHEHPTINTTGAVGSKNVYSCLPRLLLAQHHFILQLEYYPYLVLSRRIVVSYPSFYCWQTKEVVASVQEMVVEVLGRDITYIYTMYCCYMVTSVACSFHGSQLSGATRKDDTYPLGKFLKLQ